MCFDSLSRRKGRTILTVLGVFIGCTSIIVMVSIGAGMQESYDQMLKNMGDLSIIEVYRGYNQSTGTQTESKLDDKAVESFHEIAGVQAVMPKASLDGYNVSFKAGVNGRYTANWVDFAGIDSSALEDMGFELMDGRYPESSDEVVVGQYFAYNFFDTLMRMAEIMSTDISGTKTAISTRKRSPTRFLTRSRRASPWYSHRMTTVQAPNLPPMRSSSRSSV